MCVSVLQYLGCGRREHAPDYQGADCCRIRAIVPHAGQHSTRELRREQGHGRVFKYEANSRVHLISETIKFTRLLVSSTGKVGGEYLDACLGDIIRSIVNDESLSLEIDPA